MVLNVTVRAMCMHVAAVLTAYCYVVNASSLFIDCVCSMACRYLRTHHDLYDMQNSLLAGRPLMETDIPYLESMLSHYYGHPVSILVYQPEKFLGRSSRLAQSHSLHDDFPEPCMEVAGQSILDTMPHMLLLHLACTLTGEPGPDGELSECWRPIVGPIM